MTTNDQPPMPSLIPSASPQAATSASRNIFPAHFRLKKSADFQQVYDRKHRASDQHLLLFARQNGLGWNRIGLSVSRKQGNAVRRNRIKRLLREAFRLTRSRLPSGYDLVLIPRVGMSSSLHDYQRSLKFLMKKIDRVPRKSVES